MKSPFSFLFLFFFAASLASGCGATPSAPATPAEPSTPKPSVDWLACAPWLTDYDKALAEAKGSGKPVLVWFTRDVAGSGTDIENKSFSIPEFTEWAKQVVLLHQVVSAADADDYRTLLHRKGGQGLPYLVFLDGAGDVVAKHAGPLSAKSVKQCGSGAQSILALEKKADAGDGSAAFRALVSKLETNPVEPGEASRQKDALGALPPEQRSRLDTLLRNNELHEMLNRLTRSKDSEAEVVRGLLEIKKGGRVPTDMKGTRLFWGSLLQLVSQEQRASLREEALHAIQAMFPGWIVDYDKALAESKQSGKPVFAYFTCGPDISPFSEAASFCGSIESGTFSDPKFVQGAGQMVLFCQSVPAADVEASRTLFRRKGGQGLPYLVFLDGAGDVVAKHVGPLGAEDILRTAEDARSFLALEQKAEAGDRDAAFKVLVSKLEMNPMDPAEASRQARSLGDLLPERKSKLDALVQSNEVRAALQLLTRDKASQLEAGHAMLAIKKAGRIPSDRQDAQKFWATLLQLADHEKDAVLYEEALNAIKTLYPDIDKTKLEPREKRLKELQGKRVDTPKDGKDTTPSSQEKP